MKKVIVVCSIILFLFYENLFPSVIDMAPSDTLPITTGTHIVPIDYDLDGDLDLVVLRKEGDGAPGSVMIFQNNNGIYSFASIWDVGDLNANYNAISSGDINNDGFMDLVLNKKGESIRVILNNYGGFNDKLPVWEYTNNSQVRDLKLADFNNDGNLDLAVANYSNNCLIFKGDGTGIFSSSPDLVIPGTNFTLGIAVADMNKDGNLDLICANNGPNNMIYLLNGNWGINTVIVAPVNPNVLNTKCVDVADIDNDGDFDIIYGGMNSVDSNSCVQVLTNNGNGILGERSDTFLSGPNKPVFIDMADINADGFVDMLITFEGGNVGEGRVFTNQITHFGMDGAPKGDMYAIFCDYDNDSDLDLIIGHIHKNTSPFISNIPDKYYMQYEVRKLLPLTGKNALLVATNYNIICGSIPDVRDYTNIFNNDIKSVAVGDVNGVLSFLDKDDYVVGLYNGMIYLYTNTSPGYTISSFKLAWSNNINDVLGTGSGYCAYSMAIGDVNGDGAPDLVVQASPPKYTGGVDTNIKVCIFYNDSTTIFNTNVRFIPPPNVSGNITTTPAEELLIEDIDNDGDNDIIGATGGPDWIAYNKGGGLFNETTSQYPEVYSTHCLSLGDIDGDGDMDLVRGNTGEPVEYSYGYANNNGVFDYNTIWKSPVLYNAGAIVMNDIDKDGDIDLCFANSIEVEESFVMKNYGGYIGTSKDDYLWPNQDDSGKYSPYVNKVYSGVIVEDIDDDNDMDLFFSHGRAGFGPSFKSNVIFKGLYFDNFQVEASNILNTPAYIKMELTASPTNVDFSALPILIKGYDSDSYGQTNSYILVRFQISLSGGSVWKDATYSPVSPWIKDGPLPSSYFIRVSKNGYTNKFFWNALSDGVQGTHYVQRVTVYPQYNRVGRIYHAAYIYYDYAESYVNGFPTAFISSPVENGNVSGNIKIVGAAYDYDFQKYIITIKDSNNNLVTSYTSVTPVPPVGTLYTWNTSNLSEGVYFLFLDVYDRLNQVKSADSVMVNVIKSDSNAPTVTAVYPRDGAEDVPANSPVIIQFSRYMNVNTMRDDTMKVYYNQEELSGNAKYKNLVKALIFDPSENLTLNATHLAVVDGDFKDVLGNEIGNDYMWNFKAEKGLPECIERVYPTGEDIATNTTIRVYYNSDMSGYTNFNDNTFYVQDLAGNKVSGTVSLFNPISNYVEFIPDNGLQGSTIYIVTIKKDIISDSVPYPYSWYFITKDTVIPEVVSTTPAADEDFFDPQQEIKIEFNKTMNVNQLQEDIFELKDSKGKTIDGTLTYDMEHNILIFKPLTELSGITHYIARLKSKFEDMGGQEISSDYVWNFRTTQILSSKGGIISSSDNNIKLRMPKNAVSSSIAISISKLNSTELSALPSEENLRNIKQAYRFYPEGSKFHKPVTIVLSYSDNDNNGYVDDPDTGLDFTPKVDEKKLALFYYNEEKNSYERIGGTVDTKNNTITAVIKHFSIFAIFEDSNNYQNNLSIKEINIYPRIFKPSIDEYLDISFEVELTGEGSADISIYNLAGRMIKNLTTDMIVNNGVNHITWDGKDNDNDLVHNRMYVLFISITDASGNRVKKTKTFVVEE